MFSAPQYPVFHSGCSQRNEPNWTSGVKVSLCKMAVDCMTGKFFHTQQKGHEQAEEPFSAYVVLYLMQSSDPVQISMLCGDLLGGSTTCLELLP
ncbi:hypothetical protein TNCV_3027691 [Trichonephila clavipes]|nr:hypothetical protein TNCV_3027691 [Trichonephila clavipes]